MEKNTKKAKALEKLKNDIAVATKASNDGKISGGVFNVLFNAVISVYNINAEEENELKEELLNLNVVRNGDLIKSTCKELGITQKELAEYISVHEETISKWARGVVEIPKWAVKTLELN